MNTLNTKNVITALIVALVIGTVLNTINNYEVIADGKLTGKYITKIVMTYITPFCVSLYSSVKAQRRLMLKKK